MRRNSLNISMQELAQLQAKANRGRQSASPKSSKSKYGNRKTLVNGISFDSAHEASWYEKLLLLERAGEIKNLQLQVSFPLRVDGIVVQRYRADFWFWERALLRDHGAIKEWVWAIVVADAKSEGTTRVRDWPRTKKLCEACYGVPIREVL